MHVRLVWNGSVLADVSRHWYKSASTQVAYGSQLSRTQPVFGVLQGSILGPPLFVSRVLAYHGLVLHQYADDCHFYISTPVIDATATADRFSCCLDDVEAWLN